MDRVLVMVRVIAVAPVWAWVAGVVREKALGPDRGMDRDPVMVREIEVAPAWAWVPDRDMVPDPAMVPVMDTGPVAVADTVLSLRMVTPIPEGNNSTTTAKAMANPVLAIVFPVSCDCLIPPVNPAGFPILTRNRSIP